MVHSSNLRNGILNTLVCLLLVGCQVKGMELVDPDPKDITRRDLFLALGEQGKLLVVYGLENEQFVQSLKTSVQSIRFRNRPLEVEVNSRVEKDIARVLAGPGRGDYYTAARFYYDNDKDLKQAHAWAVKANEIDAKFWQLRLQSLIEAKLGKTQMAIETAKKSMEMAKAEGNMDYVRMNKKSIVEWTKKAGKS